MAKRTSDWRKTFNRIMRPRLLKALRDDEAKRIPLRAAQRRSIVAMLKAGAALPDGGPAAARRPRRAVRRRSRGS